MSRTSVRYACTACGHESPKWLGRCPACGDWGVLEECEPAARAASAAVVGAVRPMPLDEIDPGGAPRRATGVGELDRVLGGGLVAGSVTLIGGEPGMGKSTMLLQALGAMAADGARCLLAAAEESPAQVRLRADRIGASDPGVLVVADTSLPALCAHAEELRPDVLAVDSVQTVHDPDGPGAPGSVSQVRDVAQRLVRLAKEHAVAVVMVGHVTKDGSIAGPRALEHVVDTVLSFEGDRHHALRMLRALKHRFGPTDELGLLEMQAAGLRAVADPSALFLGDRRCGAPGSVVAPVLEGARPICVEVQALADPSPAPMPRRVAHGIDSGRVAMLLAVLQRRAGLPLASADLYTSVAGGVRVGEPGIDLAVAIAIASAWRVCPVAPDTVVLGEIGLGGEVRQVPHGPRRLGEALRLGFRRAVVPRSTPDVLGLELIRVETLADAIDAVGLTTPP